MIRTSCSPAEQASYDLIKSGPIRSGLIRPGQSVIELLCVVAVISLLLSLLLPAVQAAREAGRRTVCQSKLRNVALAMIQMNDAFRRLPENRFHFDNSGNCTNESLWFDKVRPFLELPAFSTQPGRHGPFEILSCPSSPSALMLEPIASSLNGPIANAVSVATTDYVGSAGVNSVLSLTESFPQFSQRAGLVADIFDPQRARYEQEIAAGRTHTLAGWETSGSQRRTHVPGWPHSENEDWKDDSSLYRLRSDVELSQNVDILSTATRLRYVASSAGLMRGYMGYLSALWQPMRDPGNEQLATPFVVNVTNTYHGPYTYHATTFTASFFDGSARPLSLSIDPLILFHLATVANDGIPSEE